MFEFVSPTGDEKDFFYMKTLKERFPELWSEIQGPHQVQLQQAEVQQAEVQVQQAEIQVQEAEVQQAEIHLAKRQRVESGPVPEAALETKSDKERLQEVSAALTRVKRSKEEMKAAYKKKMNDLKMERLAVEVS